MRHRRSRIPPQREVELDGVLVPRDSGQFTLGRVDLLLSVAQTIPVTEASRRLNLVEQRVNPCARLLETPFGFAHHAHNHPRAWTRLGAVDADRTPSRHIRAQSRVPVMDVPSPRATGAGRDAAAAATDHPDPSA